MKDYDGHANVVSTWLRRIPKEATITQVVDYLDLTCAALWRQGHTTISEVVLSAIMDRVLVNAHDRFPWLALRLEASGLRFDELRRTSGRITRGQITDAAQFIVADFISILGHMTGEILSPGLHKVLLEKRFPKRKSGGSQR